MIKGLFFFGFAVLVLTTAAQTPLTAEEALDIALKNNYDIRVSRSESDIGKTNNTPGNAGMLPAVALKGSGSYSQQQGKRKLAGGTETDLPKASSTGLEAGVALDWTLFDGGKMFVTKRKLTHIEELGEIQFRDRVLQTVYAVTAAYYDVVRQKQQLSAVREVIAYNQERVKILETGFKSGLTAKPNLLQAQIDLNVFLENALAQELLVSTAKRTLNQLLARQADAPLDVMDTIPLSGIADRSGLVEKLNSSNTAILSSEKQVEIAGLSINEYRSLRWPKITLNAGYGFSQQNNPAGTVLSSQTYGPQIGGTVSIPLFQGGNISRQVETAKLQLKAAEYTLENIKIQASAQLLSALEAYDNQRKILDLEIQNNILAKENLEIAMNRLRLGQSTSLEFKLAEDSYMDSRTRLVDFTYNLKATETRLKQLIAGL